MKWKWASKNYQLDGRLRCLKSLRKGGCNRAEKIASVKAKDAVFLAVDKYRYRVIVVPNLLHDSVHYRGLADLSYSENSTNLTTLEFSGELLCFCPTAEELSVTRNRSGDVKWILRKELERQESFKVSSGRKRVAANVHRNHGNTRFTAPIFQLRVSLRVPVKDEYHSRFEPSVRIPNESLCKG